MTAAELLRGYEDIERRKLLDPNHEEREQYYIQELETLNQKAKEAGYNPDQLHVQAMCKLVFKRF